MTASMTQSDQLRELVDREAVRDLLVHFSYCVDEKRWQDWQNCFDEGARIEFPFASYDGLDGLAQWAEQALEPYPVTHHLTSNVEIRLDDDAADLRSKLLAAHLSRADQPGVHFDVAGIYHWHLVRRPEGWRIRKLRLEVSYTNGTDPSGLAPTA